MKKDPDASMASGSRYEKGPTPPQARQPDEHHPAQRQIV